MWASSIVLRKSVTASSRYVTNIYYYYDFYQDFRNTLIQLSRHVDICNPSNDVLLLIFPAKPIKPENTCLHRRVCCVADQKAVRTTDAKRIANNNNKPEGQVDATGLSAVLVGKLAPLQSAYRVWCDSVPGPVLLGESPLILCFHFQSLFFPHFSFCYVTWRPYAVHFK